MKSIEKITSIKKITFIIMLAALSACSKKSAPAPAADATVTYHLTGNAAASYYVGYIGSNGKPIGENFTGTTWSKTITAKRDSGFTNAVLSIVLTSQSTAITGSADISVNSKISSQVPITLDSNNGSTDLTFYATVFK